MAPFGFDRSRSSECVLDSIRPSEITFGLHTSNPPCPSNLRLFVLDHFVFLDSGSDSGNCQAMLGASRAPLKSVEEWPITLLWGIRLLADLEFSLLRGAHHMWPKLPLLNKADHYGSAEILFGQLRSLPTTKFVLGATKWCVFQSIYPSRAVVETAVRERMQRMKTKRVDLLQFHWQDYADNRYMMALHHLRDLQSDGLITAIGLCNFDTIRTDEICTQLGPGALVSNQVQFSVIDTRPLHGMSDVCAKHKLKLLTYGTLCGGFLSDQWLDQSEPDLYSGKLTPSQRKYLDVIVKVWGNWQLFQELLSVLRDIGDRHGGLSVANIATRWVLDHPFVGAVIVGVRLGLSEHPHDNQRVYGFHLTDEDNLAIESVLERSNGRQMITTIGDCGSEYR